MLKQHSATSVLRSRITIVSSMPSAGANGSPSVKMSTADGSVRAQQPAPRASDEIKQQKPQRPPSVFFPLGYKDAAYQWVSSTSCHTIHTVH